jgi:hypothetical protein
MFFDSGSNGTAVYFCTETGTANVHRKSQTDMRKVPDAGKYLQNQHITFRTASGHALESTSGFRKTGLDLGKIKHDLGKTRHDLGKIKHDLGKTRHDLGKIKHDFGKTGLDFRKTGHGFGKTNCYILMDILG